MEANAYVEFQGDGSNPVLLLHGLGCNGAVWDGLVSLLLDHGFSTIVPDFPGHGRSTWASAYSIEQHAAAIASKITPGQRLKIIGHSMGAMVGLALASNRFDVEVSSLFSIGLKILWSQDEMDRMGTPRPVRTFSTRSEAADRFLRVNGLAGLIGEDHRCVDAGLVSEGEGFRLATDPLTVQVVHEPVAPLLEAAIASQLPLRLSCGREDLLVDIENMRQWDPNAIVFENQGHNVHTAAQVVFNAFLKHIDDCGSGPII